MLHAFVLAAQTFPVRHRPEDARAEESVALRLERAVVDRFGLRHLAVRPMLDLFGRGQTDADRFKIWCELRLILLESKHLFLRKRTMDGGRWKMVKSFLV